METSNQTSSAPVSGPAPAAAEVQTAPRRRDGCFFICPEALSILLSGQVSADEICAYLTLARFTDATGVFSTAGVKAIRRALGTGPNHAEASLKKLQAIRPHVGTRRRRDWEQASLVQDPEIWSRQYGTAVPVVPSQLHRVRWILSDFSREISTTPCTWIGNGLVDGFGKFRTPLATLRGIGVDAVRMLLAMYARQDFEENAYSIDSITPHRLWSG